MSLAPTAQDEEEPAPRGFFNARRRRAYPLVVLTTAVVWSLLFIPYFWWRFDQDNNQYAGDFVVYWAASELVLDGRAEDVYDLDEIHEIQERVFPDIQLFPWHYPPQYLLIVAPLGLAPFVPALAGWLLVTLSLYLAVLMKTSAAPRRLVLLAAFPAVFVNVLFGQNGFLIAALTGVSLASVGSNPRLAGACIGVLTFKPHLLPVLVVGLAAARKWHILLAGAAAALAFVAVATVTFGLDIWATYVADLDDASEYLRGAGGTEKMPTVSAALQLAGASPGFALAAQAPVSIVVLALVAAMWVRDVPVPVRNAAIVVGMVLASPYAFIYDMPAVALGLAWLLTDARRERLAWWESTAIITAAIAPIGAWVLAELTSVQSGPLVLAAVFAICVRRAGLIPAREDVAIALDAPLGRFP